MTIIDTMLAMLTKSAREGRKPRRWRIPSPTMLEIEDLAASQRAEIFEAPIPGARTILGLPFHVYQAVPGAMVQIEYADRASEG